MFNTKCEVQYVFVILHLHKWK